MNCHAVAHRLATSVFAFEGTRGSKSGLAARKFKEATSSAYSFDVKRTRIWDATNNTSNMGLQLCLGTGRPEFGTIQTQPVNIISTSSGSECCSRGTPGSRNQ